MSSIRRTIDDLKKKNSSLDGLLDTFGDILEERAKMLDGIQVPQLDLDKDKLAKGLPLLVDEPLAVWKDAFASSAATIVPVMSRAFPAIAGNLDDIAKALADGELDSPALMQAVIAGDDGLFKGLARELDPGVLKLAVDQAMRPLMETTARKMADEVKNANWLKGTCPVCGSHPDIEVFRKSGKDDAYLTNHGGQRWLHCPRCATQWRFKRHTCPFCDNEENGGLIYFMDSEDGHTRADACKKCKRYLVGIDVSEFIEEPDLDVAALGMIPMDVVLQSKGYVPLADTVWTRIEEQ